MTVLFFWVVAAALNMKRECFSETLVSIYESTRRHNPEQHRHAHRRENLKSHINSVRLKTK
jgi:hypothetical protein